MSKLPIFSSSEAEKLLIKAGFIWIRTRGSHRIYKKSNILFVLPFHQGKDIHPKLVKQLLAAIEDSI
ncbi:MAG: type II toxin-antitoxin system HicA family toxin [Bacteroidetes bacterium]|nr:type II toxin-antitoxin system HicA family toxin [Bacteroidota bacterium]